MRRVAVVVTARPSYSRIKTALEAIQSHPQLELHLVLAGSALLDRYGSAINQVEKDGFSVDSQLWFVLEGDSPMSMAKTTGIAILELAGLFNSIRPDLVVTIADRYETLANAVTASYMNIPLAHIQGGEVSGSIDEKVRHAVTKLADIHCVCTNRASERLLAMGEDPSFVFNTGCPSIDLAARLPPEEHLGFDPYDRYGGVGTFPDLAGGYVVAMQHPVTTEHKEAFFHANQTLHAARALDLPVLWFWPNVDAGSDGTANAIRAFREAGHAARFHFFKNMAPLDFLQLLVHSKVLLGNSSVGIRECSYLGVPVVNIGSRQNGRECGRNVVHVPYEARVIHAAASNQIQHGSFESDNTYGAGDAGARIAGLFASVPLQVEKRLMI